MLPKAASSRKHSWIPTQDGSHFSGQFCLTLYALSTPQLLTVRPVEPHPVSLCVCHTCTRICVLYTASVCAYMCVICTRMLVQPHTPAPGRPRRMAGPRRDSRGGRCLAPHNDHEVLIFPTHLQRASAPTCRGRRRLRTQAGSSQMQVNDLHSARHVQPRPSQVRTQGRPHGQLAQLGLPKWPPAHKLGWGCAKLHTVTSGRWADF